MQGPKASQAPAEVTGTAVPDGLKFDYPDTSQAGFYTAEMMRLDKTTELRTTAVNVDATEGDLRRVGEPELTERLAGVRFQFRAGRPRAARGNGIFVVALEFGDSLRAHGFAARRTGLGLRLLVSSACEGSRRMTSFAFTFAPSLLAQASVRTTFEWGRIRSAEDWLLPLAVAALVVGYVGWMYRRDTRELKPWAAGTLITLRLLTFAALLAIWLRPQWRREEDVVTPSRVVVLVDTSLSMSEPAGEGTPDGAQPAADSARSGIPAGSRSAAALDLLQSPAWREVRRTHELHLVGFSGGTSSAARRAPQARRSLGRRRGRQIENSVRRLADGPSQAHSAGGSRIALGDGLMQQLFQHRAAPVSGFVLLTDGSQNTGLSPLDAVARAKADRLSLPPLYPVGLGSAAEVKNLRLQDLAAPARTYPADEFTVKAYVQAQGMAGRTVTAELLWRELTATGEPADRIAPLGKQSKQVVLPEDGRPIAVEFALKPEKVGRTNVQVRIANPPSDDHNHTDNVLDADVEITERRNRILLFASAATREYQFLRNQLQRILRSDGSKDKEFVVDVYLQTGSDGISQDSSEILPSFPETSEELHEYDCIIAFDPDWRMLAPEQVTLLKQWIENEAGGMIIVAGRVFADSTARDKELVAVRSLYPVEFGGILAVDSERNAKEPWALTFTPDGQKSEFLRLADGGENIDAWDAFPGFYDYFNVKGVKDKAVVLAGLDNPDAGGDDDERKYLLVDRATGAGRVLYIGSGEFWRLRAKNSAYFTRLYTQMVRHVSQARLLRDSKRGVLLVDHDNGRYQLNDVVEVRARLMDAQAQPLSAEKVTLNVVAPDRANSTLDLTADPALPGNFRGLLPVRQTGSYRLDVVLPDGEPLTRRLQVRIPNKESDDIRLNETLLRDLASVSQGAYFPGPEAVFATSAGAKPLTALLQDKTRITPRLARPVSLWDNQWTLALVCSLLCLEWLLRRLLKLA
ncbi:MAG: hypothetical protein QM775_03845 [Pirellulales bacterium]